MVNKKKYSIVERILFKLLKNTEVAKMEVKYKIKISELENKMSTLMKEHVESIENSVDEISKLNKKHISENIKAADVLKQKNVKIADLESENKDLKKEIVTIKKEHTIYVNKVNTTHRNEINSLAKDFADKMLEMDEKQTKANKDTIVRSNGTASFTCEHILDIRAMAKDGINIKDIAQKYEVSSSTISRIVANKTYTKCK